MAIIVHRRRQQPTPCWVVWQLTDAVSVSARSAWWEARPAPCAAAAPISGTSPRHPCRTQSSLSSSRPEARRPAPRLLGRRHRLQLPGRAAGRDDLIYLRWGAPAPAPPGRHSPARLRNRPPGCGRERRPCGARSAHGVVDQPAGETGYTVRDLSSSNCGRHCFQCGRGEGAHQPRSRGSREAEDPARRRSLDPRSRVGGGDRGCPDQGRCSTLLATWWSRWVQTPEWPECLLQWTPGAQNLHPSPPPALRPTHPPCRPATSSWLPGPA